MELSPSLQTSMCLYCSTPLVPGLTCLARHASFHCKPSRRSRKRRCQRVSPMTFSLDEDVDPADLVADAVDWHTSSSPLVSSSSSSLSAYRRVRRRASSTMQTLASAPQTTSLMCDLAAEASRPLQVVHMPAHNTVHLVNSAARRGDPSAVMTRMVVGVADFVVVTLCWCVCVCVFVWLFVCLCVCVCECFFFCSHSCVCVCVCMCVRKLRCAHMVCV
jgi:hypothetical protein